MRLEGKVALVSGASLGIGHAIALELADQGADVAVNYRRHKEEAEGLISDIKARGRKGLAFQTDVSSFEGAGEMVRKVLDDLGRLDILVNNAGINWDGAIWKMTEEQWDTVLGVNLKGYFNYVRAAAPIFREQKSGRIVNVTSINGMRGKFGQSNYSASKAGIIGLTKTVARELGKYGVTVNAVAPGMIMTAMMEALDDKFKEAAREETVLKRLGQPEDVARLVAFLCSDDAVHITGEVIKVDGGQYI